MIVRHYLHTEPAVAISYLFGCGGKAMGTVPTGNGIGDEAAFLSSAPTTP